MPCGDGEFDSGPATGARAVTTSDTLMLPFGPARALYIGVTGDVVVTMWDHSVATFKAAPVGMLPIVVRQVWATNTTATNILALY